MKLRYSDIFVDREDLIENRIRIIHERGRKRWWGHPSRWFVAILIVSILLSYVYVLKMEQGGEVTFLSMLALAAIGYICGPRYGIAGALLFAVIKYCLDYVLPGYAVTALMEIRNDPGAVGAWFDQMKSVGYEAASQLDTIYFDDQKDRIQLVGDLFDYIFGYGVVGLFGLFCGLQKEKKGRWKTVFAYPQLAFFAVIVLRYAESVLNYILFYPENESFILFATEALTYSFSYALIDGVLALIVFMLPSVTNVILFFRTIAHNSYDGDLDEL
ncbi:MAG: energy-coupled thiamine transporter ThiT [Lachnospiraceae bacterium]|nr:energy-coupled thiamine transporter ThiT [Lachnospiraceae bacterium]